VVPCTRPVPSPRRPRRGKSRESEIKEKELLKRIGKLEGVVEGLKRGERGVKIDGSRRKGESLEIDERKTVGLLAEKGNSRYVSDRFWASFSGEVS
jgi:hypothetical protein